MEGVKKLVLMLVFVAIFLSEEAVAKDHEVGGSQGWDESVDFGSWASGQTFKVGDKLVFKYSPMHSVVELGNESAYKSCDIGSAVDSKSGGNSVVKLDKPGTRYFACGTMGHCGQGMKLKVTTVSSGATSSNTTPSPSSSSSSTPSSSSSSTHSSSTTSASPSDFFRPFSTISVFMVFALLFAMI